MLAPTLSQPVDAYGCTKDVAGDLISLPAELLVAVFMRSDCQTILRCCRVCRRFNDVVDASVELQYVIELALDGMIDGGPSSTATSTTSPPTTIDRLTHLRQLRQAWLTLTWRTTFVVQLPGACSAYEFVGGVFAKTSSAHDHPFRWGSKQFSATWLPSVGPGGDGKRTGTGTGHTVTLRRDDLGLPTRDFALDPSQDLIVLFKGREENTPPPIEPAAVELHVRTISTNTMHPEANEPILRTTDRVFVSSASILQIADDIVGMLFFAEPERPRLSLWNWKTGKQIVSLVGDAHPPGTSDFSFISPRAFFFTTVSSGGMIQIFTFGHEPPHPDAVDGIVHVANLVFPKPRPPAHVINLSTHAGPVLARCPPNKSFTASNEARVHVLNLQYINPISDGMRASPPFCAFFHNRVLVDYIRRFEAKGGGKPIVVPWENWGPMNTRFLQREWTFQWLRYVHGQRVVLRSSVGLGSNVMQVLDFNVRNCWRQRRYTSFQDSNQSADVAANTVASDFVTDLSTQEEGKEGASVRLVDYPTLIDQPLFFTSPVETHLPYFKMKREELTNFSGVMIDDERLVGMKYPVFWNGDMRDIHVFAM